MFHIALFLILTKCYHILFVFGFNLYPFAGNPDCITCVSFFFTVPKKRVETGKFKNFPESYSWVFLPFVRVVKF